MFAKLWRGGRDMKDMTGKKSFAHLGATNWDAEQLQHAERAPQDFIENYEPLLSCWQALDGRARLIISRDGTLLATSDGTRGMFVQNGTRACAANLTFACPTMSGRQLKRLLGAKIGVVETVVLPKWSGGGGNYVISAVGISATAVAIAIREADDDFVTVFADLEDVFGLTPCEVLVVERLMRGHGAQHIANDLGVSVHTVRAHLRHCYDKLGVSSREALWQRLAPYRLN